MEVKFSPAKINLFRRNVRRTACTRMGQTQHRVRMCAAVGGEKVRERIPCTVLFEGEFSAHMEGSVICGFNCGLTTELCSRWIKVGEWDNLICTGFEIKDLNCEGAACQSDTNCKTNQLPFVCVRD